MRIFVSSSFEDLKEHRAAAIRVLRQLGHEVLAMEDMIAGSAAPLAKVFEMVDRSEAYVGIFAWRYGYVPAIAAGEQTARAAARKKPVATGGADDGVSITHHEYLRALDRKLPIMAFLLDESYPWPPQFVDGFDRSRADAPANAERIRELRQALMRERVVSFFTTPTDLEARVSAAVTVAGLTSQLDLQEATALDPDAGVAGDSSAEAGITDAIISAGDRRRVLKIDLVTPWWSTRLYLIAALASRLTFAQRILIVDSRPETPAADDPAPGAAPTTGERFVGQLSVSAILSTIGPKVRALGKFAQWLKKRPPGYSDVRAEIPALLDGWCHAFGDTPGAHDNEREAKVHLSPELLRRWFGEAMLQQPLHVADLQRASVVDLLRLLDYPNDYVPVLTRDSRATAGQPASGRVNVVDKRELNARLARSYLVELLDRARIT